MSKKLYFLISFVLVLSLSGFAQAGTPIVVDNYSFEYDVNGNNIGCHTGLESVLAWEQGGVTDYFAGVDVNCGWEDEECDNCHDWVEYPNGTSNLYFQGNVTVYQILDHNIVYGHKYTMTVDLMAWDPIVLEFFSPNDVCTPDVNHLLLSQTVISPDVWLNADVDPTRWMYDRDVEAICVIADEALTGRKLGIKIGGNYLIGGSNTDYLWADNVRVEYGWASNAYDPDPPDGAGDVNSQAVTLSWLPGLWAVSDVNGHEVYFGTSWADVDSATTATAGIYRGTGVGVVSGPDGNDRYSYVIPGGDLPFALGESYFWRIDEVNDDYVGPVPQPWKGEVWSFEVEGKAKVVYPVDGAVDIPALNLTLYWEAGVGAGGHDVYFGTSQADVTDANTSNTGLYPGVYRGPTQPLSDVNYAVPEGLEVGEPHFWRIDEVNTISGTFVEGDVWSFTTGMFLLVDSFEPYRYVTTGDLTAVWVVDLVAQPKNDAQLSLYFAKTDANKVYAGEQSMEFAYRCYKADTGVQVGSWAAADMPVEVGTDWTVAGVKALVVNFYGDPCNGIEPTPYDITQDQMWVAVEDTGTNEGVVRLPNMSEVKEASWHTWDISLIDPNFSAVDMNNVKRVYIGFGGAKVGQKGTGAGYKTGNHDSVWFDDIRLYPPRCMPSVTGLDVLSSLGDIAGGAAEGDPDCNTNYLDLDIMAQDWASIDGLANTENRPAVLTGYPDTDSHWTTDCAVGTGAIEANEGWNIDVTDPRLRGLTSMSMTCWVQRSGASRDYESLVSSREYDVGCGDDATELGIYQNEVGYDWSCGGEQWSWSSDLIVPADSNWAFIAVSVDPTGASAYLKTSSGALETNRNEIAHPPQQNFVDDFTIGNNDKEGRDYFPGKIDDVRIYGYALDFNDMNNLAYQTATDPNPWPVYWYKFDETEGLSAADYGTPIQVYSINMSPANLVPKDPNDSEDPNLGSGAVDPNNLDIVNFVDYRIMAEHWLEQHLWP